MKISINEREIELTPLKIVGLSVIPVLIIVGLIFHWVILFAIACIAFVPTMLLTLVWSIEGDDFSDLRYKIVSIDAIVCLIIMLASGGTMIYSQQKRKYMVNQHFIRTYHDTKTPEKKIQILRNFWKCNEDGAKDFIQKQLLESKDKVEIELLTTSSWSNTLPSGGKDGDS